MPRKRIISEEKDPFKSNKPPTKRNSKDLNLKQGPQMKETNRRKQSEIGKTQKTGTAAHSQSVDITELADPYLKRDWARLKKEYRRSELFEDDTRSVQEEIEIVESDQVRLAEIKEEYEDILKMKQEEQQDAKAMGDEYNFHRLIFVINRIRRNLDLIKAIELKLQSRFEQLQRLLFDHDQHQNNSPSPEPQQPIQTSIPSLVTKNIDQSMHQDLLNARNRRLAISSQLTEKNRQIGAFIRLKLNTRDAATLLNMLAEHGKLQKKFYNEKIREGKMMGDLQMDGHDGDTPAEGNMSPQSEEVEDLMEAFQGMPQEEWQAEWNSFSQPATSAPCPQPKGPELAIDPGAYEEVGNASHSGILDIPPFDEGDAEN